MGETGVDEIVKHNSKIINNSQAPLVVSIKARNKQFMSHYARIGGINTDIAALCKPPQPSSMP